MLVAIFLIFFLSVSTGSKRLIDCSEKPTESGVMTLWNRKQVKCNEGWTSIMLMRVKDKLNANRTWAEYEQGFGLVNGSHWTGLKVIATIMAQKNSWQFKFTAKDSDDKVWSPTIYKSFRLDAKDNYRLHVNSDVGSSRLFNCRVFENNHQNGMAFSTKDRDNDNAKSNCAAENGGGFWYNACGSLQLYSFEKQVGSYEVCERSWQWAIYALKEVRLEMRPN